MELIPNDQAILLLTAPLAVGKHRDSKIHPLTLSEYNRLARFLKEAEREPADLFSNSFIAELDEAQVGVHPDRIRQLLARSFLLSQSVERWSARSIWVVTRAESSYPQRIKRRLGETRPPVLYGCGDKSLLDAGGLAVVGSREADESSIAYSENVGRLAAAAEFMIISGGARGIDTAAMRGATVAGGCAVGILPHSLEREALNREHRDLFLDGRLVLVSPYDPRAGFNVGNAMSRNKLVYAIADAALVVQTDYGNGGTWNGAVEQLDSLQFVPVYVRSDVNSAGIKALIRKGAHPWPNPRTPEEFSQTLAGLPVVPNYLQGEQPFLFPQELTDIPQSVKRRFGRNGF